MVFELKLADMLIVALVALSTSFIINWIQNRPVKPIGIIDFIIGKHTKTKKIHAILLVFINPVLIGFILGFFNIINPIYVALGTAIGAFFTVSAAFFAPEMLAPPLKNNIGKTRVIYLFLVLTYGSLGYIGGWSGSLSSNISLDNELHTNLLSNIINQLILISIIFLFKFIINKKISPAFKSKSSSGEKPLNKHVQNMITMEITKAISEITASVSDSNSNSNKLIDELKESIKEQFSQHFEQIYYMIELAVEQELIRQRVTLEFDRFERLDHSVPNSTLSLGSNSSGYFSSYFYEEESDSDGYKYISWSHPGYFS